MHRGQERILKEEAEVMREPLISVIVPVYNVEGYVGKCITSLLQQTYPRFEAILVDDGSMDNSGKICTARCTDTGDPSSARRSQFGEERGAFRYAWRVGGIC